MRSSDLSTDLLLSWIVIIGITPNRRWQFFRNKQLAGTARGVFFSPYTGEEQPDAEGLKVRWTYSDLTARSIGARSRPTSADRTIWYSQSGYLHHLIVYMQINNCPAPTLYLYTHAILLFCCFLLLYLPLPGQEPALFSLHSSPCWL